MIGYAMLGTNNKEKAEAFYDGVLGVLGAKRTFNTDRGVFWGTGRGQPMLGVGLPFDKSAASAGNGAMVALTAPDQATVQAVYKKALELGGKDEGEPGFRTDNFYGAYFRDLDGNKLAVFFMGAK